MFVWALVVPACGEQISPVAETLQRSAIVGTWLATYSEVIDEVTYAEDGAYTLKTLYKFEDRENVVNGTWDYHDGVLTVSTLSEDGLDGELLSGPVVVSGQVMLFPALLPVAVSGNLDPAGRRGFTSSHKRVGHNMRCATTLESTVTQTVQLDADGTGSLVTNYDNSPTGCYEERVRDPLAVSYSSESYPPVPEVDLVRFRYITEIANQFFMISNQAGSFQLPFVRR